MADKQPTTANEVLAQVDEDHDWKHDPADISTTGGIQRALERHRVAIQRLADFIDGKYEEKPDAAKGSWFEPTPAPAPAPATPAPTPAPAGQ
jgi:hypothetical protein